MKNQITQNILLLAVLTVFLTISSCGNESSNSTSSSAPTYTPPPAPTCKPSTSKVRSLVRSNWNAIKRTADFKVSDKGSFEINDYGLDGDEVVVDIYSKGYMYDISFTVSFDASFDDDCDLDGDVLDCYNYRKH